MSEAAVIELADRLWRAETERQPIQPMSDTDSVVSIADAYAIQAHNIERRVAAGHVVRGRKIGLTSQPMQELLGVDEPDFGVLVEDMFVDEGDEIPLARGQGPGPGRPEGVPHQPRRLPRRGPSDGGIRDRRLPPAVPDRKVVPHIQTRPRPIYHHQRDSIEAHLTIVFAALAVSRWIEDRTGWSIKKFVRTARRYRTIEIQAGTHTITAATPYPTTSVTPRSHHPSQPTCALT
jgi:hypothetical protein